ncbi:uroporphyrinogen decarboxylase/cobalamine-independent methonine synthase family protein [Nesterenkonia ebinurensis]|uniref:hypothetical protein n=1 Tax=Nesterenkonia ebinurensis TaxID=2608252 RepID=UPI00168B6414|nr:hypothetical protein [Nesterenkonia ebinurensis]
MESELTAPHHSALLELPGRRHHGSLLGRATAQLSELYAELTSYGWRLVPRPGADHQRASTLLTSDVNTLAEIRGERAEQGGTPGPLRLEMLGPVSLATQLHLPNGEKVLIDHGARRDLAESLAAGAAEHIQHALRSVRPPELTVTMLEPDYQRVRTGSVPTVSGYQTIRSLPRDETRQLLGTFITALRSAGAENIILDLGRPAEAEHIEDFRGWGGPTVDGFALPLHRVKATDWERTAGLVESDAQILADLLHPREPHDALPEVSQLAARIAEPWQKLGMPASSLFAVTITAHGARHRLQPAQLSEAAAMRTLTRLRDTAEALTDLAA